MTDPDGGAMPPGDRFKGIEQTLIRIEQKLDKKVDLQQLDPLYRRVDALESGDTPLARQFLKQWEHMQDALAQLTMHGSQNSQLAVNKGAELEIRFARFEQEHAAELAVLADRRTREGRLLRVWAAAITGVTACAATVSAFAYLHFH